jgi:hypothetical protein
MSGRPNGIVLLNLTPTRAKDMKLMMSDTLFQRDDKFERHLPSWVQDLLVSEMGKEAANFAMFCDLWPLIDIDKYVMLQQQAYDRGITATPFALVRQRGTEGMAF